jgi:hypothetical protein
MNKDFKDLLSAFHAHHVKYLIVGGYAVSFYSQPRSTKDIDIFIRADPDNARAAFSALASFGAPLADSASEDLATSGDFFRFGIPPNAVDILPAIQGVVFDEAWSRRVEGVIDQESGLKAFFISRDDLIASKLAAGRLQDLADVESIQNAKASEGEA